MRTTSPLTEFQVHCEASLREALSARNVLLTSRSLEGYSETFIRANLGESGSCIFIYEDEAQIQGHNIDIRFEAPDYASSSELADAFVKAVENLLDGC